MSMSVLTRSTHSRLTVKGPDLVKFRMLLCFSFLITTRCVMMSNMCVFVVCYLYCVYQGFSFPPPSFQLPAKKSQDKCQDMFTCLENGLCDCNIINKWVNVEVKSIPFSQCWILTCLKSVRLNSAECLGIWTERLDWTEKPAPQHTFLIGLVKKKINYWLIAIMILLLLASAAWSTVWSQDMLFHPWAFSCLNRFKIFKRRQSFLCKSPSTLLTG